MRMPARFQKKFLRRWMGSQTVTVFQARFYWKAETAKKRGSLIGIIIVPTALSSAEAEMSTVYLSLGSNLGDRSGTIARAVAMLGNRGIRVTKRSSLYETEPVGVRDGGWFLNAAVEAETDLSPAELLRVLLEIERALGRERGLQSAEGIKESRTIDLDVLLFGSNAIRTQQLEIPHPRMAERKFVLVPLEEIAATVKHPAFNKTISQLLAETKDQSVVRMFEK